MTTYTYRPKGVCSQQMTITVENTSCPDQLAKALKKMKAEMTM